MYYNYHYSLLSEFERRHNKLNQNQNIEIIEFCKKQSDIVNEMQENRMLDKSVYNRFNQIEFINYIPLEIFKQVVNDLYFIYKKEIPFGDIKSFLKNNFDTFLYECEILAQNLERGKVIWWDTLANIQFYNYYASTHDYRMVSWISKNNDDSHFYALYLKKIIEFLEIEIITEIENFERNSKVIIKTETIQVTTPKHENIFCNNGFVLFEYILKEYVRLAKGRQTDLLFYYWKMFYNKPQYIHQRPTDFFIWFDKEYSEISGQLKTYDNVKTPQKEKNFSNSLDWFKLQNK